MCICQQSSWLKALTEREAIKEVFSTTPCLIEIAQNKEEEAVEHDKETQGYG